MLTLQILDLTHLSPALLLLQTSVISVQMVDRLDQGALPRQEFSNNYTSLYKLVQKALYRTHVEGQLKGDIIKDPASYVELDPDMAKTLMDQRQAVRTFCSCCHLRLYSHAPGVMSLLCHGKITKLHKLHATQ